LFFVFDALTKHSTTDLYQAFAIAEQDGLLAEIAL
jgi:hypothetical protein